MYRITRLSYITLVLGIIYIVWLGLNLNTPLSPIFYIQELAIFLLYILFMLNHRKRRYQLNGGDYSLRPMCDIFIPTRNEPLDILEQTVKSVAAIYYSNKRIYLLDDSAREEVKNIAKKYNVKYL